MCDHQPPAQAQVDAGCLSSTPPMPSRAPTAIHAADQVYTGPVTQTHQYIVVNGEPRWIQTVSRDVLVATARSLYRVSRRHENLAACAVVLPLLAWFVFFACLRFALHMQANHTLGPNLALAVVSGGIPFVVWCAVYDVRRRHRCALRVVESRWAELQAEIAVRDADQP